MFNPGDVVQVFFPFAEGQNAQGDIQGKDRPALVLTVPDVDGNFVAAVVTSIGHHPNSVAITSADSHSLKLVKASYVRADKLFTFNNVAVIKRFGAVKIDFVGKVRTMLCPALATIKPSARASRAAKKPDKKTRPSPAGPRWPSIPSTQ